MEFVRKKNPFLEPYIIRGGRERESKNEQGFRENGISLAGASLWIAWQGILIQIMDRKAKAVRILTDLVLD